MYDKFIVIKRENLHNLNNEERKTLDLLLNKVSSKNEYYIVNVDEPYSEQVKDLILGRKSNYNSREIFSLVGECGAGKTTLSDSMSHYLSMPRHHPNIECAMDKAILTGFGSARDQVFMDEFVFEPQVYVYDGDKQWNDFTIQTYTMNDCHQGMFHANNFTDIEKEEMRSVIAYYKKLNEEK
jgi:ABC-type dipeptide/oligopeptide/nickel transport system ATPase component